MANITTVWKLKMQLLFKKTCATNNAMVTASKVNLNPYEVLRISALHVNTMCVILRRQMTFYAMILPCNKMCNSMERSANKTAVSAFKLCFLHRKEGCLHLGHIPGIHGSCGLCSRWGEKQFFGGRLHAPTPSS